ncbi:hypothetical protein D1159_02035 [Pseudoflavonifractor sp. 524-17]|uniref:DUF7680 family protein n=1 Tax=Pseudoflavonifractor sp. 524-17 TaxID=2304577 RepID=UPI0013794A01|nr:hypothetical protein [Pseudoflavonifractor sp. 524-17]NCE63387.1 hypothetical protein [Pseudoflavonifractor sp. 524-17]
MDELNSRQRYVVEAMGPMLKKASWILRVSDRKEFTGPVLEICERRPTPRNTTKLYEYGRIYNGALRACRRAICLMMSHAADDAGRPLNLQELLDGRIVYRGQIPLDEITGAKLALLFKLHPQVRSAERIELMAWRIERFSREETMYWLSKVSMESLYGRRGIEWAKSGLRLMLAGQQKDAAEVRRLLERLRK